MRSNKEVVIHLGSDDHIVVSYDAIRFVIGKDIEPDFSLDFDDIKQIHYQDYRLYPFMVVINVIFTFFTDGLVNPNVDKPRKVQFKYINKYGHKADFDLTHDELTKKRQRQLIQVLKQRLKDVRFKDLG